jgi:hypothetical protein
VTGSEGGGRRGAAVRHGPHVTYMVMCRTAKFRVETGDANAARCRRRESVPACGPVRAMPPVAREPLVLPAADIGSCWRSRCPVAPLRWQGAGG